MNREDDPQLWDLLSRSSAPAVSPFFARNVVRAVRSDTESSRHIVSSLQLRRIFVPVSVLAAVLLTVFSLNTIRDHGAVQPRNPTVSNHVHDGDVAAADLDVLTGDDDDDVSVL